MVQRVLTPYGDVLRNARIRLGLAHQSIAPHAREKGVTLFSRDAIGTLHGRELVATAHSLASIAKSVTDDADALTHARFAAELADTYWMAYEQQAISPDSWTHAA